MSSIQWPFPSPEGSPGQYPFSRFRARSPLGQEAPGRRPGQHHPAPGARLHSSNWRRLRIRAHGVRHAARLDELQQQPVFCSDIHPGIGIGFVAMHQCQRNLVGLELAFAGTDPVSPGRRCVSVSQYPTIRRARATAFACITTAHKASSRSRSRREPSSRCRCEQTRRGYIHLERFGIRTMFPFELFRAWAWLHMDLRGLVYPDPADEAPQPPPTLVAHGHRQHDARGEEDFAGLRRYHEGDSPRHVAWKAYARSGQLLSKQFAGADTSSQWFDFNEVPAADVEQRLSILTRWIVDSDQTLEDYGLRLPGRGVSARTRRRASSPLP